MSQVPVSASVLNRPTEQEACTDELDCICQACGVQCTIDRQDVLEALKYGDNCRRGGDKVVGGLTRKGDDDDDTTM